MFSLAPSAFQPADRLSRQPGKRNWKRWVKSTGMTVVVAFAAALLSVILPAVPASADAIDTTDVEIINAYSGWRVDVVWGSRDAYQPVFLWWNNTSASQEFDLIPNKDVFGKKDGYYRIRARHSGQCLMLDWRSGYYRNGTPIIQYPNCEPGYSPSEWYLRT